MALFMDTHEIDGGVKAADVAQAHLADLQTQDRYGVRYLRYWVHEAGGNVAGAVREWERLEMPFEKAMCLAASGDVKDLQRAHQALLRLGATAFATHVRTRIRGLGGAMPRAPRPTTRSHPSGLTTREAEIAGLLAEGLSNDEIAGRLVLSPRTVAHHVSAVLGKLGLERRSQVAAALR